MQQQRQQAEAAHLQLYHQHEVDRAAAAAQLQQHQLAEAAQLQHRQEAERAAVAARVADSSHLAEAARLAEAAQFQHQHQKAPGIQQEELTVVEETPDWIRQHASEVLAKAEAVERERAVAKSQQETAVTTALETDQLTTAVIPHVVTEDSTDGLHSISKLSPAKKAAKKRAAKPKPHQTIQLLRTPVQTAPRTAKMPNDGPLGGAEQPSAGNSLRTPEQQPAASPPASIGGMGSSRKRLLGELEEDALTTALFDVRRMESVLLNDKFQSPSKKAKDENVELEPLLGREPWYPQDEEEIVLLLQSASAPDAVADSAAAHSQEESL
jgi:hypothetical protein